jgi:hypothetical protein
VLWFGLSGQMAQVAPAFFAATLLTLLVRAVAGDGWPGWSVLVAPLARPCCGRWPAWCCWRRSAARRTPTRTASCEPGARMTELRNIQRELERFRFRSIAAAAFVLLGFGLLIAGWWCCRWPADELSTQAEANRIAVLPIVPNAAASWTATAWCWPPTTRPTRWRSPPPR